ncbi:MAG: TPM domain-containing protein [Lachnospiraceae bacterium]|nr:TPM domain-containing protein [Lachnospiraceae bacterium]
MREYFRFFRIPFIIIGILAVITIVVKIALKDDTSKERTNTECTTQERVFDYADKLTDSEEESLRNLIAKTERETKSDIVVVTLNESLVEYAASYADKIGSVPMSKCVMVYADNFYDEHKFGWDQPIGDGVLFLDNWYREADGRVYSWMSTSGRVIDHFSTSRIDSMLDRCLADVDNDPYGAYSEFVVLYGKYMSESTTPIQLPMSGIVILSFVVAGVFFAVNWSGKKGKKTVNAMTYVPSNRMHLRRKEDHFLRKSTTSRHIPQSSSSGGGGGGGGGHFSAGGSFHGGGGHSR